MAGSQYNIKLDANNAAAVDSYLEYRRIVGDDDGGQMFTPEQYEEYKKKVLPMRLENRLFTSWTNSSGMDCKQVGPETPCFCQHRYKQHKTDFSTLPSERPILLPCRVRGCLCASYHYVPLMSGRAIRCSCKHLVDEHSAAFPYQCANSTCQKCAGFKSSYTCGCGEGYMTHQMIVESVEEREARGHPIGQAVPYQAMGGLTGFSSLAEGYMRLDQSGRGAPTEEFLSQEITSSDNVFLRANVPSIQAHRREIKDYSRVDEDMPERISAARKQGETDMDYFERRYQERLKAEKPGKRAIESPFAAGPSQAPPSQLPHPRAPGAVAYRPLGNRAAGVAPAPRGGRQPGPQKGQRPTRQW